VKIVITGGCGYIGSHIARALKQHDSNNHVYITPNGNFAVLEFDENDKEYFLETGVTSPAFGLQISWISWAYGITIQKGY
jgi:nucleoside-diphosphate-sugar epimerase